MTGPFDRYCPECDPLANWPGVVCDRHFEEHWQHADESGRAAAAFYKQASAAQGALDALALAVNPFGPPSIDEFERLLRGVMDADDLAHRQLAEAVALVIDAAHVAFAHTAN